MIAGMTASGTFAPCKSSGPSVSFQRHFCRAPGVAKPEDLTHSWWVEYGLLSEHVWEIDHIVELALGGADDLANLRARHWRNNRSAGGYLGNALAGVGGRRG
jgi:hypothetical protein